MFAFFILFYFFTRSTWTQLSMGPMYCTRDPHHFQRPHIGFAMARSVGPMYCSRDPQISLFSNFFIKNESHDTIHTFKNYFTIIFSVFSFSNNKFNPNGPILYFFPLIWCFVFFSPIIIRCRSREKENTILQYNQSFNR